MVKRVRQAIISSLIFLVSTPLMALEEPKYTVIESAPPFELRQYAPMIIAEVTVDGDMSDAGSKGFRLIAGYIFGKNQTKVNLSTFTGVFLIWWVFAHAAGAFINLDWTWFTTWSPEMRAVNLLVAIYLGFSAAFCGD